MKRLPKLISLVLPFLAVAAVSPGAASAANNGSDLTVSVSSSGSTLVNTATHIDVTILNSGNRNSGSVTVAIQLPKTATSPTVFVMGTLSNVPGNCSRSGTNLLCALSTPISRNGGSALIGFDITLPVSANPIQFHAEVTTNNDRNNSNNATDFVATQTYHAPAVAPTGSAVNNSHCTGRNLSSYFECTAVSGAVTSHPTTLVADGSIDWSANGPEADGLGGTWSVSGSQLTMQYTHDGQVVGNFVGMGSTPNCWDGPMLFVPSGMAMYRVCL